MLLPSTQHSQPIPSYPQHCIAITKLTYCAGQDNEEEIAIGSR